MRIVSSSSALSATAFVFFLTVPAPLWAQNPENPHPDPRALTAQGALPAAGEVVPGDGEAVSEEAPTPDAGGTTQGATSSEVGDEDSDSDEVEPARKAVGEPPVSSAGGSTVPGAQPERDSAKLRDEQASPAPNEEKKPAPEGFVLNGFDGQASLRVGFLGQIRSTLQAAPDTDPYLSTGIRLARPYLSGHVLDPRVRWFFQGEFAAGPNAPAARLLDAEIDFLATEAIGIRFGQFRTPTGRQWMNPLFGLQFPGRSPVSDYYRAGRDLGIELGGTLTKYFAYRVGAFNGNGQNSIAPVDHEYLVAARVEIRPNGVGYATESVGAGDAANGFNFALLANHQKAHVGGPITNPQYEQSTYGVDFLAHAGRLTTTGEMYFRDRTEAGTGTQSLGGFLQAGVFVMPKFWELAARGNYVSLASESGQDAVQGEASSNLYFMGDHLKLNTAYVYTHTRGAGSQFFGGSPVGTGHLGILQVQVFL